MKCEWHKCTNEVHGGRKVKYCSQKCKNKTAVTRRRRTLKVMAVEHKGGKCSRCGYNKSVWALDFHHRNPDEKLFGVASKGHGISWKRLKSEIDKCDLVCRNCHAEIEEELFNLGR